MKQLKWWNCYNGDLFKCKNIRVLFSYLRVLLSLPFMERLTGPGGGCPCQFLLHICPFHPLHLHIRLFLPLPHNLSPHNALLSFPLPLPHHLCPPRAPLSIYLPLPLPLHILPPHATLSLTTALPHNLLPFLAPLYISLPLHFTQPPCLFQNFPRFHSYPKMIQIIQYIYLLLMLVYVSLLLNVGIRSKRITNDILV